ncbi:MAG: hypothetical protein AAGF54_16700 [Pseudomonadota bacterium]
MLRKFALATTAILALTVTDTKTVTPAKASPQIFENLSGKWRGRGTVKAGPKAKAENIRCRMTAKPKGNSRVNTSGNCAVGGFVFSLGGFIEQNGSVYTASMFRSLANIKQNNFSGKRSGTKINFSFNARDRLSKQNISARILLNSKSNKSFDVQITRTDPKSGKLFKVGTIKFTQR